MTKELAEALNTLLGADESRMETSMTHQQALDELERCISSDDTEAAHSTADEVLCQFLIALGYKDVVEVWRQVNKWYA